MTAVKKVKKERLTLSAIRYARVLSELGIARETVEEAFEAFEAVPELAEVLASGGRQPEACGDRQDISKGNPQLPQGSRGSRAGRHYGRNLPGI